MATFIPAIRTRMGGLEYFISAATLGEAARLIEYVEEVDDWTQETPPQLKLQRKLNVQRVEREMVPYLVATDDHFYSSLTVEIRPAPHMGSNQLIAFEVRDTFPGGVEFGVLTLDGTETLYALDGQHRLKSIELAIRQRPELAREHISLILVPFQSIERSQTLFSDLNRHARSPSKSISLLFTHRDPLAQAAKMLAADVPVLRNRVNMESTSLSSNARHFITLSTLYEMTKIMAHDLVGERIDPRTVVDYLAPIWAAFTDSIPEWQMVAQDEEHPAYLRQRYLHMHGVGQQAIANAVADIRQRHPNEWITLIPRLGTVDWQIANSTWQGVAVHGGRVYNTTTSVRLLAERLTYILTSGGDSNVAK